MGTELGAHVLQNEESQAVLSAAVASIPEALHGLAVVEIGSGVGGSAQIIHASLQRAGNAATLHCIDACVMSNRWVAYRTAQRFHVQRDALEHVICALPQARLTVAPAAEVLKAWTRPIAFLFIDGGHTLPDVMADLEWARHVVPGGLMAVHDFGRQLKEWGGDDVTRAMIAFMMQNPNWRWIALAGSMLLLQRTS